MFGSNASSPQICQSEIWNPLSETSTQSGILQRMP